ncbi:MAG TPA: NUDIX domain-containing protein [Anaerolineales bacterium]|nr:NUDIX domain-containing protein [Anaerolineales bacterium]
MSLLLRLWGSLPLPSRLRWAIVSLFVPKFAVGVVGVIFNEQGEILLFHHTYRGKRYPWGLPGGWLDPRENPAEGIVREIREETGLTIEVVRPLLIENALIFRRLDLIYLCKIIAGTFHPSTEVDAIQYFRRETLPPMLLTQSESIHRLFDLINGQLS